MNKAFKFLSWLCITEVIILMFLTTYVTSASAVNWLAICFGFMIYTVPVIVVVSLAILHLINDKPEK